MNFVIALFFMTVSALSGLAAVLFVAAMEAGGGSIPAAVGLCFAVVVWAGLVYWLSTELEP